MALKTWLRETTGYPRVKPTEKGFQTWVMGQDDLSVLGYPGDAYRCPVANYVKSLGYDRPLAVGRSVSCWGVTHRRFEGDWIERVINASDTPPSLKVIRAWDLIRRLNW